MTITKLASFTARKLAKLIAQFASDKKAEDIVVLDMRKVANFCDYFVLCSGNSDRQTKAIARGIEEGLYDYDQAVRRKQGLSEGRWVIMDFGTVVAHVFDKERREFYGLDYLWQEAKQVKWA